MQSSVQVLQDRQEFRLVQAAGWRLRCVRGALWVSQANDPRDRVLERGEAIDFPRPDSVRLIGLGRALFHLEPITEPARVPPTVVLSRARANCHRRGLLAVLRRWLVCGLAPRHCGGALNTGASSA